MTIAHDAIINTSKKDGSEISPSNRIDAGKSKKTGKKRTKEIDLLIFIPKSIYLNRPYYIKSIITASNKVQVYFIK